ncbi:MAG TPA: ABC transporter permease [Puia sp.]|nr:ABC transporter permease [Puia sp.]
MIRNYLKVAWRNLRNNKLYSFINIAGLATGMSVAGLIGLWIQDELSFDKTNTRNYDRIGQVMQNVNFGEGIATYSVMPIPLAKDMRSNYPDFQSVALMSQLMHQVLAYGDKLLSNTGAYTEPEFPEMMTLKMLTGQRDAIKDMNSVLLSSSAAVAIFGTENPIGKIVKFDNRYNLKVGGVYADFPRNSSFYDCNFLGAWDRYTANDRLDLSEWDSNSWRIFAQLKPGASFGHASALIKYARKRQGNFPSYHPEFFLYPMSRWHLYADFKNGINIGGLITIVWLFGIIGAFVLLLACINFMNLSTARSERRAREVGIRKTLGSVRRQLVAQFLNESLLVASLAFILSLLIVELSLPFFNRLAEKDMTLLWSSPTFWAAGIGFTLLTGILAGSYPALYLSSFRAIKVLKGSFKAGRFAAIPRKALVTLQFTVSVFLIVGTAVVYRQIEFVRNIPTGYSSSGLIQIDANTKDLKDHAEAIRNELLSTGAATAFAMTSCPVTDSWGGTVAFSWPGKDPSAKPLFMSNEVTPDFGKAVGWKITRGRDFSRDMLTDSSAMILNEAAVKKMGLKDPLGMTVKYGALPYTIIGVVADIIQSNPFRKVAPAFYCMRGDGTGTIELKLNTKIPTSEALQKTASIFKKYNPASPFTYNFADDEYAKKFGFQQRIGSLAAVFAALAIFISCLGLFGLASFVAEQRTKEIGIRKVLGASLVQVWRLLSAEFFVLVGLSCLIAMPSAWYLMNAWLQNYDNQTNIPWWIFAASGCATLLLTLITVSSQAIRAGLGSPVKALRTE